MWKGLSHIILSFLCVSYMAQTTHAFDNACSTFANAITMTSVKLDIMERRIGSRHFSGYGSVRDVISIIRSYDYWVQVDCGNDVIVIVKSGSAGLKDIKVGQKVNYTGEFKSVERRLYVNTKKPYISVTLVGGTISY